MTLGRRLRRDLGFLTILCVICAAMWVPQALLWEPVVVATGAGLQTLFQVIAAAMVGIVVLLLGSIFLISQHLSATFGQRSVTALLLRPPVRFMFAAALLLSVGAILLAGQIPDGPDGDAHKWILAAAGTLAIGSSAFICLATFALAWMAKQATSWKAFMDWLVMDAGRSQGGLADHHASIARQALTRAARAKDGHGMTRTLEAICDLVEQHALRHEEHQLNPALRIDDNGAHRWANELSWALLHAGEEALRDAALWRDLDRILSAFEQSIRCVHDAGMPREAAVLVDGLAQLAAVGHQLDHDGALRTAWLPRCATALTKVAADRDARDSAWAPLPDRALVGWAFATVAVYGENWQRSVLFVAGRRCLGNHPDVGLSRDLARTLVDIPEPFTSTPRWNLTAVERTVFLAHVDALLRSLDASVAEPPGAGERASAAGPTVPGVCVHYTWREPRQDLADAAQAASS